MIKITKGLTLPIRDEPEQAIGRGRGMRTHHSSAQPLAIVLGEAAESV